MNTKVVVSISIQNGIISLAIWQEKVPIKGAAVFCNFCLDMQSKMGGGANNKCERCSHVSVYFYVCLVCKKCANLYLHMPMCRPVMIDIDGVFAKSLGKHFYIFVSLMEENYLESAGVLKCSDSIQNVVTLLNSSNGIWRKVMIKITLFRRLSKSC